MTTLLYLAMFWTGHPWKRLCSELVSEKMITSLGHNNFFTKTFSRARVQALQKLKTWPVTWRRKYGKVHLYTVLCLLFELRHSDNSMRWPVPYSIFFTSVVKNSACRYFHCTCRSGHRHTRQYMTWGRPFLWDTWGWGRRMIRNRRSSRSRISRRSSRRSSRSRISRRSSKSRISRRSSSSKRTRSSSPPPGVCHRDFLEWWHTWSESLGC